MPLWSVARREAIKQLMLGGLGAATLPAWVANLAAAADAHAPLAAAAAAEDWAPRALNAHQDQLVIAISELIIPQTETPGAKAALVNRFIDAVLEDADSRDKKEFLRGLAWLDERSAELFGADFLAAGQEQQSTLLTLISSDKNKALADRIGVEFFPSIKGMTLTGYYTSELGLREELGDDGLLFFAEFKGCTHPEHGGPAPAPPGRPLKPPKKA